MNSFRQLKIAALRCVWGFSTAVLLSGCFSYHHSVYGKVGLVSHPASVAALKKWDLAAAMRILEPRLAASPQDAQLSYTLGCVYLMQSDEAKDRASRLSLRRRGWQLVEAASGKDANADALLAHAHLVGRWGRQRSSELYAKHLQLSSAAYRALPVKPKDEGKRTWVELQPPRLMLP